MSADKLKRFRTKVLTLKGIFCDCKHVFWLCFNSLPALDSKTRFAFMGLSL